MRAVNSSGRLTAKHAVNGLIFWSILTKENVLELYCGEPEWHLRLSKYSHQTQQTNVESNAFPGPWGATREPIIDPVIEDHEVRLF